MSEPTTRARELRALQDAATIWPMADLQLITLGQLTHSLLPPGVKIHQAADCLLLIASSLDGDLLLGVLLSTVQIQRLEAEKYKKSTEEISAFFWVTDDCVQAAF